MKKSIYLHAINLFIIINADITIKSTGLFHVFGKAIHRIAIHIHGNNSAIVIKAQLFELDIEYTAGHLVSPSCYQVTIEKYVNKWGCIKSFLILSFYVSSNNFSCGKMYFFHKFWFSFSLS